ncbi:MAG: sulfatase, partial [Candidatus Latescibacterota bacterium]
MATADRRRPCPALTGLLLLALAGVAAGRPNVVLITVDTFRPDHIGYWGYGRQTTPSLDSLCTEGVFFRQAFSSSAWTTPGLISILTSLYAPTHGVDIRHRSLDPEVITLPEVMIQGGYRAPDIFFLTDIPNFANLGLQPYPRRDELIDRGDDILFHWLEAEAGKDAPFFLYYHYRDVHLPYDAGESYESHFLPGAFASPFPGVGAVRRFLASEKLQVVRSSVMITRGVMDFASYDRPWVSALYDAEIRRLDEAFFRRLGAALRRPELARNTLVLISADHGEGLLEHGLIGHVSTFKEGQLYDELTRIPLIIWYPQVFPGPRVIDEPVQCIDVMPTILDLVHLPVPAGAQGRSLVPLIGGQEWTPRPLFFETTAAGFMADEAEYAQRFRAVRTARWKLVHAGPEDAWRLYDLVADPGEQRDVARRHPEVADSLRQLLNEWSLYAQGRGPAGPAPAPAAASPAGPAGPAGPPRVLFPRDRDTLGYAGADHAVKLRWSGPPGVDYTVQ